jgi:hypothetical protein
VLAVMLEHLLDLKHKDQIQFLETLRLLEAVEVPVVLAGRVEDQLVTTQILEQVPPDREMLVVMDQTIFPVAEAVVLVQLAALHQQEFRQMVAQG